MALAVLRHETFQPHFAGLAEKLRADLTLLERRHEDAFGPAVQELAEFFLSIEQRQVADVIAPKWRCSRRRKAGLPRCGGRSAGR